MNVFQGCKLLITDVNMQRQYVNWKLSKLLTGHGPSVTVPRGLRLYPADRFNDYIAIATQHPTPAEWRLVDDLLAPGGRGVFVDVGANVGSMSLLAHSTGHASSILAFEPAHRYCEAWHRNMIQNNVRNATLFQTAVGDYDGAVEFRIDPAMPLNGKIDLGQVHYSTQTQKVRIVKLDSILNSIDLESIALIKIDVEGAEPLVLRGAEQILTSGRARAVLFEFIVEFIEDMQENPYEFIYMVLQLGFKLYKIETDGRHTELDNRDPRAIVDERRVAPDAPLRPFEGINLVAKSIV